MKYIFDSFVLDTERFELTDADGNPVDLQPRSLELLELLLRNRGALVDKETTQQEIWGGLHTSPDAMRTQVRKLRAALGDNSEPNRLIETVRGKGLRFVGEVHVDGAPELDQELEQDLKRPVAPPVKSTILSFRSYGILAALLVIIGLSVVLGMSFGNSSNQTSAQASQTDSYKAAVAVLPFREVGGQVDQAYVGEGFAEELTSVLARINGLKVNSTSSAFRLAGNSGKTSSKTAKELGITHIVEGSFAQINGSVKVIVRLVDTDTDDLIWTETYARPYNAENLVRVQEQIVSAIVVEMLGELAAPSQLPKPKTDSTEALDLYYRAQALLREETASSVTQAIKYFKQATIADPDYVDPYSRLVLAYDAAHYVAGLSIEEMEAGKREALAKALELAPRDPNVLMAQALSKSDVGDNRGAIALYQEALAGDPSNSDILTGLAIAYSQLGRTSEQLDFARRARDVDPLRPMVLQVLTFSEYSSGNIEAARKVAESNMRWNGNNASAKHAMGFILDQTGQYAEANQLYASVLKQNPANFTYGLTTGELYLRIGSNKRALEAVASNEVIKAQIDAILSNRPQVEQYLAKNAGTDPVGVQTTLLYFYLRDFEGAMPHVKRSIEVVEIAGPAALSPLLIVKFIAHAHVLCQAKDPDCEVLLSKIEEPFKGLTPQTAKTYDAFITSAAVDLLRGDEKHAMEWLEAAYEAGHVFVHLKRHPTFEPLAENAKYQALEAKMEAKASDYRSEFAEQIASTSN
ncbi:MAG: tetratricopeptide repeat protein [Pseudomonadota bacterium]